MFSPISNLVKIFVKLAYSALSVILFLILIYYLVDEIYDREGIVYPLIALWALISYIGLPRVHRILTKIYLPDYYVGRSRTSDGFYSDPVNIAIIGSEKNLHKVMQKAGWTKADPLNRRSSIKMLNASVRKVSYKQAPVSSLFLFGNKQDFCYQQEVDGNPRVRHHVRFWKTPKKWWLPGGHEVDWLAAATFDKSVGISLYTGQITHKISDDTDKERDYVVETMRSTKQVKRVEVVEKFFTAFRSRNGGGDKIQTDGSLPFVYL